MTENSGISETIAWLGDLVLTKQAAGAGQKFLTG
jgi:hypothetical protein